MSPDQLSEKITRAQAALPSEERGRDKITAVARFRLTAAQDVIELAAEVAELENQIKAMGRELEALQAEQDRLAELIKVGVIVPRKLESATDLGEGGDLLAYWVKEPEL